MNVLKMIATLNDLVCYFLLMNYIKMLYYIALHCDCVNSYSTWEMVKDRDN